MLYSSEQEIINADEFWTMVVIILYPQDSRKIVTLLDFYLTFGARLYKDTEFNYVLEEYPGFISVAVMT